MNARLLAVAIALAITPAAAETLAEKHERLLWEYALREDNFQAYHAYLRYYPRGEHAAEARRKVREYYYRGSPNILPLPPGPRRQDSAANTARYG